MTLTVVMQAMELCILWHAESGVDEMPSRQLISDMETAKDSLWKKHGIMLPGLQLNIL